MKNKFSKNTTEVFAKTLFHYVPEILKYIDEIKEPIQVEVKTRYSSKVAKATIEQNGENQVKVIFDEPQRAITPGQSAVFYVGNIVLGGGKIC